MTSTLARNESGTPIETRVTPWTPFRDLFGFDPFQALRSNWGFEYDVVRNESGYEVEVPVPGYKPEQIDVTLKDGVMSVQAKSDRRSFSRSFSVPEDVDTEQITADVADGLLVITLARRPEAQPKKIAINR